MSQPGASKKADRELTEVTKVVRFTIPIKSISEAAKPKGAAPKKTISPELQKKIDEMYKTIDKHVDVFPPAPKMGNIAIPVGGLAKCICSPECEVLLPQPAYHIVGTLEERWCLKKKKEAPGQKRQKKN